VPVSLSLSNGYGPGLALSAPKKYLLRRERYQFRQQAALRAAIKLVSLLGEG
jgi:hypothetical protein